MAEAANAVSEVKDMTMVKPGSAHIWESPMWIERMGLLVNSELMSDITFNVKGERFHAHKFVLSFASEVFYAMFYGTMADDVNEIEIVDCEDPVDFLEFLSLIYEGSANVTWDNVSQLSYLRKKYMIMETGPLSNFIKSTVDTANCLEALDISVALEENDMINECLKVIRKNVSVLVMTQRFLELKQPALKEILKQNILNISEINLFFAVDKWCSYQIELKISNGEKLEKREVLGDALHQIRFPLIKLKDFTKHCRPSKILTNEEMVEVYHSLALGPDESDSESIQESSEKKDGEGNEASSLGLEKVAATFISEPRLKGNILVCIVNDVKHSEKSFFNLGTTETLQLQICVSKDVWMKGLMVRGFSAHSISVGGESYKLENVGNMVSRFRKPVFLKGMTTHTLSYTTTVGEVLLKSLPKTYLCNDFKCSVRNVGSCSVSTFSHLIFSIFDGEPVDGNFTQLPNMDAIPSEEALNFREEYANFAFQNTSQRFLSESTSTFNFSAPAPAPLAVRKVRR